MSDRPAQIQIPEDGAPTRLDQWLAEALSVSRGEVQRMLADGRLRCHGRPLERRTRLQPGATIEIDWPPPPPDAMQAQPVPLEILYEDDAIRIINKAPGQVVHPGDGTPDGTVVNGLLFLEPGLAALDTDGKGRPGIVHRLDRDTSGILVTARTAAAHETLVGNFADRSIRKVYLALTYGRPRIHSPIDAPIGRHPIHRKKMAVVDTGKPAVSHFQLVAANGDYSAFAVRIETGRTHQIRVHFTHAGAPILGDDTYGRRRTDCAKRQMLHAWQLTIPHPVTGELITFNAPIPADMLEVAAALGITLPAMPPPAPATVEDDAY